MELSWQHMTYKNLYTR